MTNFLCRFISKVQEYTLANLIRDVQYRCFETIFERVSHEIPQLFDGHNSTV